MLNNEKHYCQTCKEYREPVQLVPDFNDMEIKPTSDAGGVVHKPKVACEVCGSPVKSDINEA